VNPKGNICAFYGSANIGLPFSWYGPSGERRWKGQSRKPHSPIRYGISGLGKPFKEEALAFQLELCQLVIVQFIFSYCLVLLRGTPAKSHGRVIQKVDDLRLKKSITFDANEAVCTVLSVIAKILLFA
jgi:hypothetical protein